jgi:hypothetical protein
MLQITSNISIIERGMKGEWKAYVADPEGSHLACRGL